MDNCESLIAQLHALERGATNERDRDAKVHKWLCHPTRDCLDGCQDPAIHERLMIYNDSSTKGEFHRIPSFANSVHGADIVELDKFIFLFEKDIKAKGYNSDVFAAALLTYIANGAWLGVIAVGIIMRKYEPRSA